MNIPIARGVEYQARRLHRIVAKYASIAATAMHPHEPYTVRTWVEIPEPARRGWRALARTLWMDPWPRKTLR